MSTSKGVRSLPTQTTNMLKRHGTEALSQTKGQSTSLTAKEGTFIGSKISWDSFFALPGTSPWVRAWNAHWIRTLHIIVCKSPYQFTSNNFILLAQFRTFIQVHNLFLHLSFVDDTLEFKNLLQWNEKKIDSHNIPRTSNSNWIWTWQLNPRPSFHYETKRSDSIN